MLRRPGILTRRWHRQAAAQGQAFWLIVLNGVLIRAATTMLQTSGVIAAFLVALTGDERAVGVAVAFGTALQFGPQFLISNWVA